MKRHSRPYGCTFLSCNKRFGSKNDWKRHENSQHFQIELRRCNEENLEGETCATVCYRRQTFQEHVKKDRDMSDDAAKPKVETCPIGRNFQARFWCGFCTKLIDLKAKGLEAWTERFNHIDDHFMGRQSFPKQGIEDWVPLDSDKPKGDVESPLDLSPGNERYESSSDGSASGSSNESSPDISGGAGESFSNAINLVEDRPSPKRSRSSSEDDSGPRKRSKTAGRRETLIYCVGYFSEDFYAASLTLL
jgi:hypothetical protein